MKHLLLIVSCWILMIMNSARAEEKKAPAKNDVIAKLDGLEIDLCKKQYEFTLAEVAKGVELCYVVQSSKPLTGMVPMPQDIGGASRPGPTGMYPFFEIKGKGQSYAFRDVGIAPRIARMPKTIKPFNVMQKVKWEGRNWGGPSDTGQPKGKPFPAGTYEFTVSVVGKVKTPDGLKPYRVSESVKVILKP